MPTGVQIAAAIYGAWRLLRGDRGAYSYFEQTPEGFYRSFFAAVLVAPGYLILLLIHLAGIETQAGALRILAVETIAYVITWTAYPLLMFRVADAMGRANAYIVFVVALNWSKVLHLAILLPVGLITFGGFLPEAWIGILNLLAFISIFVYQWFITRTALDTTGFAALGLVLLDVIIRVFVKSIANGMIT